MGVKGVYDGSYECSEEFRTIKPEDIPETNEYSLITALIEGDVLMAGYDYALTWDYLNGVGSSADRFDIDLYSANGTSGQCGTYVTPLCEKSEIGCRDSDGNYSVTIPHNVTTGDHRIRVGRFEDESIFDCSGIISIAHGDDMQRGPCPDHTPSPSPGAEEHTNKTDTHAPVVPDTPDPATEETPTPVMDEPPTPHEQATPAPVMNETHAPITTQTTPAAVTDAKPSPVEETTPSPVADTTPAPVEEVNHMPVMGATPAPMSEATGSPVEGPTPRPRV